MPRVQGVPGSSPGGFPGSGPGGFPGSGPGGVPGSSPGRVPGFESWWDISSTSLDLTSLVCKNN